MFPHMRGCLLVLFLLFYSGQNKTKLWQESSEEPPCLHPLASIAVGFAASTPHLLLINLKQLFLSNYFLIITKTHTHTCHWLFLKYSNRFLISNIPSRFKFSKLSEICVFIQSFSWSLCQTSQKSCFKIPGWKMKLWLGRHRWPSKNVTVTLSHYVLQHCLY